MSKRRLLLHYALAIARREWASCTRVDPKVRVAVGATVGALIAPYVVFVAPAARLYWLITGKQLPLPFGLFLTPQPYVIVSPFAASHPPEIRELLGRPEYNWEPGPGDIPWWFDAWTRVVQALYWAPPRGLKHPPGTTVTRSRNQVRPAVVMRHARYERSLTRPASGAGSARRGPR